LTQPILGPLYTNAHGDRVNLFFISQLPALIGEDRPLAKRSWRRTRRLGPFFLGLIALHASAVVYHHF
jgi:cytochrome b561